MGFKARSTSASSPPARLSEEDAIQALRHGSVAQYPKACDSLRSIIESDVSTDAVSTLLLHLACEFEKLRSDDTSELTVLASTLANLSEEPKHQALVRYSRALALYAEHRVAKKAEAEALLSEAAELSPWYSRTVEHLELGVACADALSKKNYDHLFYLMLREAERAGYDAEPSPWLLRAILDRSFSAWLYEQSSAPPPPTGLELDSDFEPVSAFARFGESAEYWPAGRREVLAALLLFSKKKYPIADAFVRMARFGDVPAVRFLHAKGVAAARCTEAIREAAKEGMTEVVREFAALGMSAGQAGAAMEELVASEEFNAELFALLLAQGASPNAKVRFEQLVKGKCIKQTESLLHIAASRGTDTAVRALLATNADPSFENALGKTPADVAGSASTQAILRSFASGPPEYGVGDALDFLASQPLPTGTTAAQKKRVAKTLKQLGRDAPLRFALGEPGESMGLLAKFLVPSPGQKVRVESKLTLEDPQVVESPMDVTGELLVTAHVLVLGDVTAREITIEEGGSLAVAGSLRSRSVYCGGQLHVAGDLTCNLLTGFDGGDVHAGEVDVGLAIQYADCALEADRIRGQRFNLEHGVESTEPEYRAAEKAVPKNCLTKDADLGVHRIDFSKLIRAATSGKLHVGNVK